MSKTDGIGVWTFNETLLDSSGAPIQYFTYAQAHLPETDLNPMFFLKFKYFSYDDAGFMGVGLPTYGSGLLVYDETWDDQQYRIIEVTEAITDSATLEFLNKNATHRDMSTDELIGTWIFNESPDSGSTGFTGILYHTTAIPAAPYAIPFTCDSVNYYGLSTHYDAAVPPPGSVAAYKGYAGTGQWTDEKYRTIEITSTLYLINYDEFKTWLKANATKQEGETMSNTIIRGDAIPNATKYNLYEKLTSNGATTYQLRSTSSELYFDLEALGLTSKTATYVVGCQADGYEDSDYSNEVTYLGAMLKYSAPTISLSDSTVSTDIVEGVTKYKVYVDSTYVGYVDASGTYHAEAPENSSVPVQQGDELTIAQVFSASQNGEEVTIE